MDNFRKEHDTPHAYGLDEYWGNTKVTIDREEYDQLVADSCLLTWLQGILNLDLEKLAETAKRIEV